VSGAWQPDISVIVPVRDRAGVIGPCLDSILASDYPADRLEVVVVDNASSDGTADVLRSYGARIRAVYEPKRGPAAARNAGLRVARGEAIAFTDSDCIVDRAWVARVVAPLADRTLGAVGGCIRALPSGNGVEHFGERIHDHARAIQEFRPAYLITMNLAARRDLLQQLHGFDERLIRCEDVDISYRIAQAGYRFAYAPDAVVYHRNRSTVPQLIAEGYAHGFYAMKVNRLHRDYQKRTGRTPAPCSRAPYSRALGAGEEKLYWFLFRSA
jgi:glycosyltransferase involved in cell wall biosynthesis